MMARTSGLLQMQTAAILAGVLRWTARVVGSLIIVYVLLHVIGNGIPSLRGLTAEEAVLWGGFVLSIAGFAMIWRWELVGGIVAVAGIAIFYAVEFINSGSFPGGWVLPLFFLPGLCSITCWMVERRGVNIP